MPHARRLGVGDGGLGRHVERHARGHATGDGGRPQIADDEGVHARCIERAEIVGQRCQVALLHENVRGDVHLHARSVGDFHCGGDVLKREVRRASAHAEAIGGQVHCVRAEAHGSAQLFDTPCGRKELHIALGIQMITLPLVSSTPARYAIST